ncbi:hypothetical protein E2562_003689 [Oryza meyeriana var. granulata]|uniref:Uncharacterized protein n=1 Tax=Oryza meyeriana var. granulata TaxID=110450 RepID=A0A6G1C2C5_9ORYZ|nr:hypothetical protein E2562_003689 [Oryza meyeriana var. granulata]
MAPDCSGKAGDGGRGAGYDDNGHAACGHAEPDACVGAHWKEARGCGALRWQGSSPNPVMLEELDTLGAKGINDDTQHAGARP